MSTEVITNFAENSKKRSSSPLLPSTVIFLTGFLNNKITEENAEQKLLTAESSLSLTSKQNLSSAEQEFTSLKEMADALLAIESKKNSFSLLNIKNILEKFSQKIFSHLHRDSFKTSRPELNPLSWHAQAQDILSHNNIFEAEKKIKKMLEQDLEYYLREQLLKENHSQIDYEILTSGSSSEGYQHSNLEKICQTMLEQKKTDQHQEKTDRANLDNLIFGEFLSNWLSEAKIGQSLAIISPPGEKSDGYMGLDSYSFLFLYQVLASENGGKKAQVEMFKLYLAAEDFPKILEFLASKPSTLNPNLEQLLSTQSRKKMAKQNFLKKFFPQVLLSPIELNSQLDSTKIKQFLEKFTKKTPASEREIKVPKTFWQDFKVLFEQFFWPQVKAILIENQLSQEKIIDFESSLNFFQRKIMDQVAQAPEQYQNIDQEKLQQLIKAHNFYQVAKKSSNKIEQKEAENYSKLLASVFANLLGVGGGSSALGQMLSLTSCGVGTVPSLLIKGSQRLSLSQKALPLDLVNSSRKEYKCPLCQQSISDPCICPRCSPLINISRAEPDKLNNNFIHVPEFKNQINSQKKLSKANTIESQSVGDFMANLLGQQQSVSFLSLLAAT